MSTSKRSWCDLDGDATITKDFGGGNPRSNGMKLLIPCHRMWCLVFLIYSLLHITVNYGYGVTPNLVVNCFII